ncbi:hypothetical protein SPPR111872_10625 [Sphingobacterium prati]
MGFQNWMKYWLNKSSAEINNFKTKEICRDCKPFLNHAKKVNNWIDLLIKLFNFSIRNSFFIHNFDKFHSFNCKWTI